VPSAKRHQLAGANLLRSIAAEPLEPFLWRDPGEIDQALVLAKASLTGLELDPWPGSAATASAKLTYLFTSAGPAPTSCVWQRGLAPATWVAPVRPGLPFIETSCEFPSPLALAKTPWPCCSDAWATLCIACVDFRWQHLRGAGG